MKEDFKDIEGQLKTRSKDKILNSIKNENSVDLTILTAPNDLGVSRNGGRRGASFAPTAILNTFKNMSNYNLESSISKVEVCEKKSSSFSHLQLDEAQRIKKALSSSTNILHIGGGHDHVYPLLKAINLETKKILCINLDAHLDTRTDKAFHSGTPFRQFANEVDGSFQLIQLGIHSYANAKSNYEELPNDCGMDIYSVEKVEKWNKEEELKNELDKIIAPYPGYQIVLSLDCDAIDSSHMEAVSAVNHNGLSAKSVDTIFSWYSERVNKRYTGIYEYNPIFDNLSQKGARYLSSLIYRLL